LKLPLPDSEAKAGHPLKMMTTSRLCSNSLHSHFLLTFLRIDDFVSDDEDYREFQANLAKARNDVEVFRASQNPERRKTDIVARGGFKGLRGPRKAAEPTGDIKARLGQANGAFFAGKYSEAQAIVTEVIRINAETHEAWTILASVFMELGRRDKALTALTYAAHLRPKHIDGWLSCARLFLEDTNPTRRPKYLSSAMFCYSSALRADSKNIPARLGKARIYVERNQPAGAVSEYKKVLALRPRDLELIRDLCAAYYDNGELENARDLYKETFAKFMANPRKFKKDTLNWSDLDSYIAIYQHLDQHEAAIKELSLISRCLLGRDSEDFWNGANDDREWDADASRRVEVPEFAADGFPSSTYGEGLPMELRIKLGLSRLGLGHHEEAMVSFTFINGKLC
jgi:general transcription factor 3C polypeptide 3 (transcription factor C subunit 4)